MLRTIQTLALVAAFLGFSGAVQAQQTGSSQTQNPIVLQGSENLSPEFGPLTFILHNGGRVYMIDASKKRIEGSYRIDNNRLVITFKNCVYEAQSEGPNVLVGTARFTEGQNAGHTWNFRVTLMPATAPATAQR